MLERLDRGNLFLVPLDDRRQWYRYHHLFADVLRARLIDEQPDIVPDLHRRASAWYEQHGEPPEAIRHALAAGDVEHAAELIERAIPACGSSRQETAMLGWLGAARRADRVQARAQRRTMPGCSWTAAELEGAEGRLRDAERWLDISADADERRSESTGTPIVVDAAEFRRLPGAIAVYRAARRICVAMSPSTMAYAPRALDLIGHDDHLGRGSAAGLLALAHWTNGDLDAAHGSWTDAMANLESAGHLADAVGCAIALADIRIEQGRLREALRHVRARPAPRDRAPPDRVLRGAADMHVGMSERFLERNDLDAAIQHLADSKEMGEHLGHGRTHIDGVSPWPGHAQAEGDPAGALALLDEAERLYVADFYPSDSAHRRVAGTYLDPSRTVGRSARLGAGGRPVGRGRAGIRPDVRARHPREAPAGRVDAGPSRPDTGRGVGTPGPPARGGSRGRRMGAAIEILVLQALAHQMRRDIEAALVPLRRALVLAEPEGYVRVFLDEGPPMAALLESLQDREDSSGLRSRAPHVIRPGRGRRPVGPGSRRAAERP